MKKVIIENEGYYRLEPPPTIEELEIFYKNKYSDLIEKGGRAPEIKKLMDSKQKKKK